MDVLLDDRNLFLILLSTHVDVLLDDNKPVPYSTEYTRGCIIRRQ